MLNKQELIDEILTRGVENIYPNKEALEKVLQSSKKLTIYNGIDPTGNSLHIGHGVVLNKLRQFQSLGHTIILLVGDFTAQIGDPTDKLATRQPLTKKQVQENCRDYQKQVVKILDPKKTKFKYNSTWLAKMNFADILKLTSEFTVQRLLERDMFEARLKEGKPIHVHEFLYPIMQGYDSVAMNVDMEIGGSDQTFNMLAGRTLMKSLKQKEKFVLTTKLLEDPQGNKMGKTSGNMVRLADSPEEMYGKVMSWTDGMIVPGFEIATRMPLVEVEQIKKSLQSGQNPKPFKMMLAQAVVSMYHGDKAGIKAQENFKQIFEEHLNPDEVPVIKTKERNIIEVLVVTKLAASKSEARRLLAQGGVKVAGKKITAEDYLIENVGKDGVIIQKGKRHFAKII